MDRQFRRILQLVKRTGDRVIVTDPDGRHVFVVMDLDHYEAFIDGLSGMDDMEWDRDSSFDEDEDEEWMGKDAMELPDEFFVHDDEKKDEPIEPSHPPKDIWEAMPEAGEKSETWNVEEMSPNETAEAKAVLDASKNAAPSSPKTEEIKKDESKGEEQFYLEPVE